MDHWDRVLPGFVLRVQHEDVVNNLDEQVHRILDFCNLPFEQACVDYHQTERSIRTPIRTGPAAYLQDRAGTMAQL